MSDINPLFSGLTVPLHDLVVLEWGDRTAVRGRGDLLAQLGADVTTSAPSRGSNAPFSRCKRFLRADDEAARYDSLARANVVVVSSDRKDELPLPLYRPDLIICDIKVGVTGRGNWTDPLLQAASGIANVTGSAAGPTYICGAPIRDFETEILSALSISLAWAKRE